MIPWETRPRIEDARANRPPFVDADRVGRRLSVAVAPVARHADGRRPGVAHAVPRDGSAVPSTGTVLILIRESW